LLLSISTIVTLEFEGCNTTNQKKGALIPIHKPGSTFIDTLFVTVAPVAVFYNPDPKQLDSIKHIYSPSVFQSHEHEFFFQQRNARLVIKKNWPTLKQVYTKRSRYITFGNKLLDSMIVDLNKLEDISGMILWDGHNKPHYIDMMSIETELSYYFKKP